MSKTQENLLRAFTGESIARNKYTFYAKKAEAEGFIWLARVFLETADNERAHAEHEYEFIQGKVKMANNYDLHALSTTLDNLKSAAEGEKYEWSMMYPDFEKQAREENEDTIADVFKEIAEVEEKHEERYLILADLMEKNSLYSSEKEVEWKCLNCGYIHKGKTASSVCPACGKPQGYYMPLKAVR